MPFNRLFLADLRARCAQHFETRLPGADAKLRHSNLRVTADVLAGLSEHELGYIDWVALMSVPDTAEGPLLERWAAIFGKLRLPATKAAGVADFTGLDGSAIPTGTRVRAGDGQEYEVTAGGTIASGTASLGLQAVAAGAAGNQDAAVALALVNTLVGVDSEAAVASGGLVGGADLESDAALRTRMLLRIQTPPQGGAASDYIAWALDVPGVTRAWVYPMELGVGTVTVRFMMDVVRAAQDGIPQGTDSPSESGDQAVVYAAIEALRPATAELFVVAPIAVPLAITVTGLSPDTPEIRAAIAANIGDMLLLRAQPGATIRRSWIWEAIALATGEDYHAVTSPAADVTHTTGQIAVPGVITYA